MSQGFSGPCSHFTECPSAKCMLATSCYISSWVGIIPSDLSSLTKNLYIVYMGYIWVNFDSSLTWIKAIWGWFPLLTTIPVRENSEVVIICSDIYIYTYVYKPPNRTKSGTTSSCSPCTGTTFHACDSPARLAACRGALDAAHPLRRPTTTHRLARRHCPERPWRSPSGEIKQRTGAFMGWFMGDYPLLKRTSLDVWWAKQLPDLSNRLPGHQVVLRWYSRCSIWDPKASLLLQGTW